MYFNLEGGGGKLVDNILDIGRLDINWGWWGTVAFQVGRGEDMTYFIFGGMEVTKCSSL